MYHILIVEDAQKIATNMSIYLERRGYKITLAFTGEEGLASLQKDSFDIAVLDIMLPGMSGYELCAYITKHTDMGVIMATAKHTSKEKILGLDTGADDYIAKPFELPELEARIRALLRRIRPNKLVILGDVHIDSEKHVVTKSGKELDLTTKQRNLLRYLTENQGIYISRTDLIEYMRGDEDVFSSDEKLDVYISVLRKKIGNTLIETRRGFGYRLINSPKEHG